MKALNYMNGLHLCHRDVKLENLMFVNQMSSSYSGEGLIKLLDFGMATKYVSESGTPLVLEA